MLQGKCNDPDILPTYETFYLFPHGEHHYYVSRFPRMTAHTGSFLKERFTIAQGQDAAEWPPEPPEKKKPVERDTVFSAKLIWSWKCNKKQVGKRFFVMARGQGLHVDVYSNAELLDYKGCYPIHWFEKFDNADLPAEIETVETAAEQAVEEEIFDEPEQPEIFEQITLF